MDHCLRLLLQDLAVVAALQGVPEVRVEALVVVTDHLLSAIKVASLGRIDVALRILDDQVVLATLVVTILCAINVALLSCSISGSAWWIREGCTSAHSALLGCSAGLAG